MKLFCVILVISIQIVLSEKLPTDFKRCNSKDTSCLKVAIEDSLPKLASGIKELGIPPLDPIKRDKLTVPATDEIQLTQIFHDIVFTGLAKATLTNNPTLDWEKGKMMLEILCPLAEFKGFYDSHGELLEANNNEQGSGHFSIKYINVKAKINVDFVKYDNDGGTYLNVTNLVLIPDPEQAILDFDGDKLQGDVHKVIDENWKPVYESVLGTCVKAASAYLMRLTKKLFEKVPLKDIFLD